MLARLMQRPGLLREDLRVAGAGVIALADGLVHLGLEGWALSSQCGTSGGRSEQGEGDCVSLLHLFSSFGGSRTGPDGRIIGAIPHDVKPHRTRRRIR